MLTHVIWDWNGTLFDDISTGLLIINRMLVTRGRPPLADLAHYRRIFQFRWRITIGKPVWTFQRRALRVWQRIIIALYPEVSRDCGLAEGAKEALAAFQAAGLHQHILSASEQGLLESQLIKLGVRQYFDHVIGQADGYAVGKTERGIRWMQEENIQPESCLLIGDTDHDALTAQKLGCRCLLLSCGHQSRERLEQTGMPVVDNLLQAAKAVLRKGEKYEYS